ncbi:CobD/CbiB family protein [Pulveribacter suum]|uniref:Cobalamin biosynthesis protein CobD n=1 Tax=Pulveribacter suum TaxID=2116657 RepID=A0A2P1NJB9_9BURK|nr:CobD/CbiB family protein [Pulveribacter suum]AVP57174.1 cobalamin biosynthesis protein CbiB [Pulveribacter suum]
MSFFAILFALLIEQARPLARSNPMHAGLRAWALSINRNFDAGAAHNAWVAWALAVLLPPLAVLGVYWALLHFIGWPLALVWNVAVLYTTLGFRQFSHHFTGIRDALEEGDAAGARARLALWKQVDASELPRSEVVRHVIEYSVIAAHRHVFGVLAWYSVCAALGLGPAGAVLYRLAEFVGRYWAPRTATAHPASSALQAVAAQAWTAIDWLPARLTALCFAVVGSFEEAIEGWRFHAQRFPSDNDGVILAATAGAINVRLGGEALRKASADAYVTPGFEAGAELGDSDSTPGREPGVGHLRSVVGLVWRSVVVWMLLLALLTLARLLG